MLQTVLPSEEPDYKVTASIRKDGKTIARLPCHIWIPRHLEERVVVHFVSRNRAHAALLRSPYDFEARLDGFDKKRREVIRGHGLWLDGPSVQSFAGNERPIVTASAQPELLTVVNYLGGTVREVARPTLVCFEMTPNRVLEPHQSIIHSYTGSTKVRTHRTLSVRVPGLGKVSFRKHYYTDNKRGSREGVTTFEKLVAEFETGISAIAVLKHEEKLRAALQPLLLLASLVTMQRTAILAWKAYDRSHIVARYLGNIARPRQTHSSINDYLIEPYNSDKFLKASARAFSKLDAESKVLLVQSMYKLLHFDETIESRFLSLFSAIEGMVLLVRRKADLEHTIASKSGWKAFETKLQSAVRDDPAITDPAKRKMIISMLPMLRRVPLKNAFGGFCRLYQLDLSDLWPVFEGCKVPLSTLRNRLVHGVTVPETSMPALVYANRNMEILVQRMIVAVLNWPLKETRIGTGTLAGAGVSSEQLAENIASLLPAEDASRQKLLI